jgi:hypothetical protein
LDSLAIFLAFLHNPPPPLQDAQAIFGLRSGFCLLTTLIFIAADRFRRPLLLTSRPRRLVP